MSEYTTNAGGRTVQQHAYGSTPGDKQTHTGCAQHAKLQQQQRPSSQNVYVILFRTPTFLWGPFARTC